MISNKKSIYEMRFHEYISLEDGRANDSSTIVFRVPGGWVYGIPDEYGRGWQFVPYHPEFKGEDSEKTTKI